MRRRVAVILNPTSGRARGKFLTREVLYRLTQQGSLVSLHTTQAAGAARSLAAELGPEVDVLVCVGGDGTLNELVNGLQDVQAATPIAVFPTGTANVVAKELHLPTSLQRLAEIAVHGSLRRLDLGVATNGRSGPRRFTMCAGAGLDATIVDKVSRKRSAAGISMLSYLVPTVMTLLRYDFPTMEVFADGRPVADGVTFALVGNMRRYGGPFRFFNKAMPDDGFLDVCCLKGRRRIDLLRYALGALRHNLPDLPDVAYARARVIELQAASEVPVQVDGDRGGALPMRFEILPQAVRFCVSGAEAERAAQLQPGPSPA